MGGPMVGAAAYAEQLKRKTYYEDSNFRVWLEELNDQAVIHVVIYRFSKAIFKDIKRVWAEVLVKFYFLGYDEVYTYSEDSRIIKMIGGAKKIGRHQNYEVWKWELN